MMTTIEPAVANNPRLLSLDARCRPPSAVAALDAQWDARRALAPAYQELVQVNADVWRARAQDRPDADLEARQTVLLGQVTDLEAEAQRTHEAAGLALLAAYEHEMARLEAEPSPYAPSWLQGFRTFARARLEFYADLPAVLETLERLDAVE